jgi:hypothetical protein
LIAHPGLRSAVGDDLKPPTGAVVVSGLASVADPEFNGVDPVEIERVGLRSPGIRVEDGGRHGWVYGDGHVATPAELFDDIVLLATISVFVL